MNPKSLTAPTSSRNTRDREQLLQELAETELSLRQMASDARELIPIQANLFKHEELRAPMNGILGLGESLKQSRLNEQQKQFADAICKSRNTLFTLLDNLF